MSSLNSLEKLIQIATMEQMYLMLQKMKNEFPNDLPHDIKYELPNSNKDNTNESVNKIQTLLNENVKKTDHSLILINRLVEKINSLERELSAIKHDAEMNNTSIKQLETHVKGQQKLTDYVGFKRFSQQLIEEEHIKLKIEEKQEDAFPRKKDNDNDDKIATNKDDEIVSIDEESEEEEEEEEELVEESEEEQLVEEQLVEEQLVDEQLVEEQEQEEESVEEQEQEEEEELLEEESEEEVATDDEDSEAIINNTKQALETSVEDDEEEVFEIEIDDVTYFATSDENGILYEVTEDGEVGSKVGIIKDGEPIFS